MAGNFARIGWREPMPNEKILNMHTCKTQSVFIRPEQYKDCMDLSLMLAWNAQCEQAPGPARLPQREVFKVDKLRGPGEGTGDALWKNEAKVRIKAHFEELAKSERIAELRTEVAQARRDVAPPPQPRPEPPPPFFGRNNSLMPGDPPVAALLTNRVGSPGTFGVKRQLQQHGRQFQRLLHAQGVSPRAPKTTRTGLPEGFHDAPSLTVSASHQAAMRTRPWKHLDTPGARDYRSMAEFNAVWKPPAVQRRVHNIRDLG
jgi:hypothetical protein